MESSGTYEVVRYRGAYPVDQTEPRAIRSRPQSSINAQLDVRVRFPPPTRVGIPTNPEVTIPIAALERAGAPSAGPLPFIGTIEDASLKSRGSHTEFQDPTGARADAEFAGDCQTAMALRPARHMKDNIQS